MGYKKWEDWQGTALDVWEETPASDIGAGLIRHVWQGEKYGVLQKGTTLKADMMNNLQMGLDFLVDSNHTVINSEDHYIITIDGLKTATSNPDGYELVGNLHFSIKITEENANGISKLIINGDSYDLQKKENDVVVELNNVDLKAGKIYSVYYDGARFLIKNSVLPSTETEAGIMSGLDIRSTEAAYITGAAYGDVFGTTLTSIEKGKVYYYWDSVKKTYIPYEALTTSAKSGGFITPDVNNFKNISNSYLAKIVEDIDGFRFTIDKQEKLLKVFRYDRSSGENIKTMNWVYNQIILFVKKHKYDLVNNTFISGYSIHQASNIQASYSTYYDMIFICYQTAGNQLVNTEQWYFHTGEMIIPIT